MVVVLLHSTHRDVVVERVKNFSDQLISSAIGFIQEYSVNRVSESNVLK